MMMMRAWVLSLLLYLPSSFAVFSAQLKNITVSQQPTMTSLYLSIQGSFTHKLFTLSQPNRVVLDLSDTQLAVNISQLGLINSLIQQVRSGSPSKNTLRLVMDVKQPVKVRSSSWKPKGEFNGIRIDLVNDTPLVINNRRQLSSPVKTIKASVQQTQSKISSQPSEQRITVRKTPVQVPHNPSKKPLRDVVVVLDAGHGGKDPGARGPRRSNEKDVVLAITLKLKRLIDRQPGMRAVLTRSGDYYVGLRQRLDIARKYNGDVFISIHADAFNNPHSNGASVFALSQRGATSEAARWLAEKENYSELGGVNLGELDDSNGVVRSVLIDLSQTATINAGLEMGGKVLGQLDNFTNLHNNKVEQARFVVLKSPDIPSILVETGFISNPREERNLTNPAYQERLSQAIFQGLKNYFWDHPPHGTRIEAMISPNFHIVKKGETLPAIAARYRVSVNALQSINRLQARARLMPGQKLVIPGTWS